MKIMQELMIFDITFSCIHPALCTVWVILVVFSLFILMIMFIKILFNYQGERTKDECVVRANGPDTEETDLRKCTIISMWMTMSNSNTKCLLMLCYISVDGDEKKTSILSCIIYREWMVYPISVLFFCNKKYPTNIIKDRIPEWIKSRFIEYGFFYSNVFMTIMQELMPPVAILC
jgi:hypothetical protein